MSLPLGYRCPLLSDAETIFGGLLVPPASAVADLQVGQFRRALLVRQERGIEGQPCPVVVVTAAALRGGGEMDGRFPRRQLPEQVDRVALDQPVGEDLPPV